MSPRKDDYAVGYGRPPKHSQFQKGQSGNPGGRSKKRKSLSEVAEEVMAEKITIVDQNGMKRRVERDRAMITRASNDALKGNNRAFSNLANLLKSNSAPELLDPRSAEERRISDEKVMATLAAMITGGDDESEG
jgi:hypothetical protein